ncbi:MAG: UvrD-helicase domain-containing protein [Tissierellia bacterium]|nr:UvrD-helicase domain-containing protein [Tissierellia bacterium]
MDLSAFNEQQRAAIEYTQGPLLVLAGAGSGKTRVVTGKIAYLMDDLAVDPGAILAITFTNKAAREMKERVMGYVGDIARDMWISTFHSMCVRMLRQNGSRTAFGSSFTIYDSQDQRTLMKNAMKALNISDDSFNPRGILATISQWKNRGLDVREAAKAISGSYYDQTVLSLYEAYEEIKSANKALDFDDLLLETVRLLEEHEAVRRYYQNKFAYVFVDEYQDTNHIQYLLVKLLTGPHPNLTVVGDNDQSIYGWRGADIGNILNFERDFSDAKVIRLEQNYRSTQPILTAANQIIKNNKSRHEKRLWTAREGGREVLYREFNHNQDEEYFVVQKMQQLNYRGTSYGDMAILYRTNAQSRGFEDRLVREGIPYQVLGGLRFYERKEIKDLIAYLTVLENPDDALSVARIINVPKRGIGAQTMEQLSQLAEDTGHSLFELLQDQELLMEEGIRAHKKIREFVKLILLLRSKKETLTLRELVERTLKESGYLEDLQKDSSLEAQSRVENLEEFVSVASDFEAENPEGSLSDFLQTLSLVSESSQEDQGSGAVTLMTVHSAKGLEFPIVFVVGLEERLFPSGRSLDEDEDAEEERRLMYVAITRAEERLFLTSARHRTLYGSSQVALPSRFIRELEGAIEVVKEEKPKEVQFRERKPLYKGRAYAKPKVQEEPAPKAPLSFAVGDKIIHRKWGQGMIVQMKGEEEAVVSFTGKGLKHLNLALAPIEKGD